MNELNDHVGIAGRLQNIPIQKGFFVTGLLTQYIDILRNIHGSTIQVAKGEKFLKKRVIGVVSYKIGGNCFFTGVGKGGHASRFEMKKFIQAAKGMADEICIASTKTIICNQCIGKV